MAAFTEPSSTLDGQVLTKLEAADVFLAVLSPNYFLSRWCRSERETFFSAHPDASERLILARYRYFEEKDFPLPDEFKNRTLVEFSDVSGHIEVILGETVWRPTALCLDRF